MSTPLYPKDSGSWIRLLVGVLLLIGALAALRMIQSPTPYEADVPKEVLVNYVPADFTFQLDDEYALAVLTHPVRYKHEFEQIVKQVNEALLDHTARRMGLPDSLRIKVRSAYQPHHAYLADLYFRDYMALTDSTESLPQLWYENKYSGATDIFREVVSKYTCFLTSHVLSTALETTSGRLLATGSGVQSPCGLALTEGLNPMMDRLRERAAILDFAESRNLMQEKVERLVTELATIEVKDKKGLNKKLQTEVMGFRVSTTDITVTAVSILKVGFDLNEYFSLEVEPSRKIVTVILPEPRVLSHEVYPRLENLSIGWMRELRNEDLNNAFNALRAEFRREALESGTLERAREQAHELMHTLFAPMIASIDPRMRLQVRFHIPESISEPYQSPFND
jgi:hypothetical protein